MYWWGFPTLNPYMSCHTWNWSLKKLKKKLPFYRDSALGDNILKKIRTCRGNTTIVPNTTLFSILFRWFCTHDFPKIVSQKTLRMYFPDGTIIISSPPGQNVRHFADDIFKRIFLDEKVRFLTSFSLRLVLKGPMTINQHWIRLMAWCRIGDKPLSEPILTRFTDA